MLSEMERDVNEALAVERAILEKVSHNVSIAPSAGLTRMALNITAEGSSKSTTHEIDYAVGKATEREWHEAWQKEERECRKAGK